MATDDLFGSDSDSGNDTDDLIASAQKQEPQPKSAKKRLGAAAKKSAPKRLQKSAPPKKKKIDIPDADNLFDDSDDSDDSEEEDGPSKKDRMEALIRARRENSGLSSAKKSTSAAKLKANKKDSTSGTAQQATILKRPFVLPIMSVPRKMTTSLMPMMMTRMLDGSCMPSSTLMTKKRRKSTTMEAKGRGNESISMTTMSIYGGLKRTKRMPIIPL